MEANARQKIEEDNKKLEDEMNGLKPDTKSKPEERFDYVNAAGNVLSISGSFIALIAGVGACVVVLNAIIGFLGINAMLTIGMLAVVGVGLTFLSSKLITQPWLPQV